MKCAQKVKGMLQDLCGISFVTVFVDLWQRSSLQARENFTEARQFAGV